MPRAASLLALAILSCGGIAETPVPSVDAAGHDAGTGSAGDDVTTRPSPDARSPITDATRADSRVVLDAGRLPACHWPTNLNPSSVPDGSVAPWGVGRTELACGDSVLDGGTWGVLGLSDSATSIAINGVTANVAECLMACEPDQYAVSECDPADFGALCFPVDAAVVWPPLPSGCGQLLPLFTKVEQTSDTSEGYPIVHCCPCE